MTPRQYRILGYDDGLNGRESQYQKVYEYMASFREGRRRLISNTINKIRKKYLWARQVQEEE